MKFGLRKPSPKRSFRARTTGKWKRNMKKAVNPFYGKKGVGFIKNPKRSIKNKMYHKTSFGVSDIFRVSASGGRSSKSGTKQRKRSGNNMYTVNKRNINPTAYFFITLFTGLFGGHKFADGEIGTGFLYLFTGGIFFVGWLEDTIKALTAMIKSLKSCNEAQSPAYNQNSRQNTAMSQEASGRIDSARKYDEIIKTTSEPDEYFYALKSLRAELERLSALEPYVEFTKSPQIYLQDLNRSENTYTKNLITRYYKFIKDGAPKDNTNKQKTYINFYNSMFDHKAEMSPENFDYSNELYNDLIKIKN